VTNPSDPNTARMTPTPQNLPSRIESSLRAQPLWLLLATTSTLLQAALAPHQQPPRLLGRRTGYTDKPHLALAGEPEAVDRDTQHQLTHHGTHNWMAELAQREHENAARHLGERLLDLERAHNRGELDASRQLAAIRRRIEALEHKHRQRAA
jgi:hypothetical protein